ncbi:accessory factor associated with RNA polymerase II [Coelomomyces lativittatus]|nr:accessory factor associated with RNA polymerase II [Coelomomyces lativittatus]
MLNVKPFLESAIFETTEEVKAKGMKKPSKLELQRKAPPGSLKKTWKIMVVDSIDAFEPDDWDRVVAVFASGMMWQFHDWKWSQPVDLFCHVRGYHLKYLDEVTISPVDQWNVKVLSVRFFFLFRKDDVD